FFSSRRRHTRFKCDWSSDVCSSDLIIILVSVPMSLAGALIFISLGIGGASINIYTQVGLVTLMGLVSKHGILMVEVANELREQGKDRTEAIIEAATIRLRPIRSEERRVGKESASRV